MQTSQHIKLINAGAGSGKTHKISHKVLEHIKAGGSVTEIFVTSFTKKAAGELRERIMEVLIENQKTEEAMKLDNAWIGTLHSLGKRVIDLFSFEAGYAPDQEVIPEEEQDFVFGQLMARSLTPNDYKTFTELAEELSIIDWQEVLLEIIKKARENNIDLSDLDALVQLSLDKHNDIFERIYNHELFRTDDEINSILAQIRSDLSSIDKKMKNKDISIELLDHILQTAPIDNKLLAELIKLLPKLNSTVEAIKEVFDECKSHVDYLKAWITLKELPDNLNELTEKYFKLIFSVADRVYKDYIHYKKERALLDYSDQENEFLHLLDDNSVQEFVASKFKLMLVDEFQDTNPMQLAIFMKLAVHIDKVFFVGDPKQSIYAFRGADPSLIQEVYKHLKQEEPLQTSRRSRHDLVNFSNHLFVEAFDMKREEIELKTWSELADIDDSSSAIRMWDSGKASQDIRRRNMVHLLRQTIEVEGLYLRDKVTKQPVKAGYGDVSILCRSNREAVAWATEFEKVGIEVSAERENLENQAEYVFMMAVLGYLADRNDTLSVFEILLLADEEFTNNQAKIIDNKLDFNKGEEKVWMKDRPIIKNLNSIREHVASMGIKETMEWVIGLLDIYGVIAKWGKQALRKANIQLLLKLAETYESHCISWSTAISLQGFIIWTKSKRNLKQQASVSRNAVKVTTYHKSKGLEWPIVIMDSLDVVPKEFWWGTFIEPDYDSFDLFEPLKNRSVYVIHNPFGTQKTQDGMKYIKPNEVIQNIIRSSDHMTSKTSIEEAEDLRILYVGITRARDYLVLPSSGALSDQSWWNRVTGNSTNGFFDNKADFSIGNCEVKYQEVFDAVEPEPITNLQAYFEAPVGPETFGALRVSPSSIEEENVKEKYAANFQKIHRFPSERLCGGLQEKDLGDALHSIFAIWRGEMEQSNRLERISQIISAFHLAENLDAAKVDIKISEFFKWIEKEYGDGVLYRELPLRAVKDGQIYAGIADLVVETEKGFVLIDYKSYQGEDVIEHSSKYYLQLNAYEEMLVASSGNPVIKKYIFYPVTGTIVELIENN